MKAFYFAKTKKQLRYNDNRSIVVGETHTIEQAPKCCKVGLHASIRLIDALKYAPGPILYLVELSGEIDVANDKIAAQSRTYLKEFDATDVLNKFARLQGLINIEKIKPYCNSEDYVLIIKWLETGEETLRSAAWSAARSAAESAAESATWSATAESAAWSAADELLVNLIKEASNWDI